LRPTALVTIGLLVFLLGEPAAMAATPTKFIDTPDNEWSVAVEGGFKAWSVDRSSARYVYTLMVKRAGHPVYALNPHGTTAELGNIELGGPHGDLLAYQIVRRSSHGNWNIGLWNLDTKTHLAVPAGVNAATKAERYPSVSDDHLLFGRGDKAAAGFSRTVILYTFSTKTFMTLAMAPHGGFVNADRVAGDFATYTVCQKNYACSVFRYQISTDTTIRLPNGGAGRAAYWSTVDATGVVYYAQGSSARCGYHTQIRSWKSGRSRVLYRFANGIEVGPSDVSGPQASRVLHFTRILCEKPLKYGLWRIAA
jgi:hypothetical protein